MRSAPVLFDVSEQQTLKEFGFLISFHHSFVRVFALSSLFFFFFFWGGWLVLGRGDGNYSKQRNIFPILSIKVTDLNKELGPAVVYLT